MPSADDSRPVSPSPSQLPPVPASPVYSIASTANPISQFNLPLPPAPRPAHAVLSKSDLAQSQASYSDLVASAKAYRLALASLSNAASAFGTALESCARLKEARAEPIAGQHAAGPNMTASFTNKGSGGASSCTADTLMAASGVHHLIANHQQILSETVYRSFEVPLLHDLDKWQTVIDDEDETYQQKIRAQSKEVKRLEKEGLKLHKQKRRDVARFRAHLVELTGKLDGLTTLHSDHARTMLRESQETSSRIVDASCSLVRAEVDIFESLAKKGWTGGGLEDVLEKGQDLFASDTVAGHASGGVPDGVKLFSILPPKSILADSVSVSEVSRGAGHARSDSLLVDTDRYQSLAALATESRAGDNDSTFSADFNKPRNARPFSPQPIRRAPMEITEDSLGAFATQTNGESSSQTKRQTSRNDDIKEENNEDDDDDKEQDESKTVSRDEQDGEEEEEEPRGRKWSESPVRRYASDLHDGGSEGGWGS
ncbi:hypothetical protein K4F52_004549 [Lecanicillium sp. MT-2017a]|nr:hypothetical protein K4F52_004549 [Lecanicillium sp. MT-2017a]